VAQLGKYLRKCLLWILRLTIHRIDLTSASRAYLMEPHWNPHVEEQAFARIHRMGQLQEVTTIRYVVNNSFEDVCSCFPPTTNKWKAIADFSPKHMLKLQTRKAHLAGLLFSQKRISDSEVNMSRIHVSPLFPTSQTRKFN
jgi:hypothetical protein